MSKGTAVSASPQRNPFSVMERLDEQMILDELKGIESDTLVYSVRQGGRIATGLSKVGIDECAVQMAAHGQCLRDIDITCQIIGDPHSAEPGAFALFTARVARVMVNGDGAERVLDQAIGTKLQPFFEERRKVLELNPFWYEHGSMKALRNARFRLIPTAIRAAVIALAKESGRERVVDDEHVGDGEPKPATPKQIELLGKLMRSHVWSDAERSAVTRWLEREPSRSDVAQKIDAAQRAIAKRKADEAMREANGGEDETVVTPEEAAAAPGSAEAEAEAEGEGRETPEPSAATIITDLGEEIEAMLADPRMPTRTVALYQKAYEALLEKQGVNADPADFEKIAEHLRAALAKEETTTPTRER